MRLLVWLVGLVWSRNCRLAHSGTFEVNHEENLEVEAGEYRYQSRELQNLPKTRQKYDGVAATLFLGSPKWFQQRYSLMINQMKSALPISWIIQIFYLPHNAMAEEAIQYHGIRKNILSGHVILTPISSSVGRKVRKKDLLRMPWFWRNLLADRVLLFGGNAVLCGSSPYSLQDFLSYDYVGAQWNILRGVGGSGELSLRNRTAVLEFIQSQGGDQYHLLGKDPEDIALAKGLANVAPQEVSLRFAVTRTGGDPHPFGLSGTLAGMNTSQRTSYIDYCPEIKILFPVLHSSECFGQAPKPVACFQFLCKSGGLRCTEDPADAQWVQHTRKGIGYQMELKLTAQRLSTEEKEKDSAL